MPTFGRRAALLENSIQLFLNQEYLYKTLLIFDDLGTLGTVERDIPNVLVMSTNKRSHSIGAKYNLMLNYAQDYDGVVVWDDDDVYTPQHLTSHAATLAKHQWSKPSRILSSYHRPPAQEDASGRFHGSIAIRTEFIKSLGGWIDTKRATFDQEILALLRQHSLPGDTLENGPISYVYRWQTSGGGHCSGLMGFEDWYDLYQPDSTEPILKLEPKLDEDTRTTLHNMSIFT